MTLNQIDIDGEKMNENKMRSYGSEKKTSKFYPQKFYERWKYNKNNKNKRHYNQESADSSHKPNKRQWLRK